MIALVPVHKFGSIVGWAIVDAHVAEAVGYRRWSLDTSGYPASNRLERLHRFLIDVPKGYVVDHINRNKLDNRLSNLRVVTQQVNTQNTSGSVGGASTFRGVYFDRRKRLRPWYVQVKHGGIKHNGGSFDNEQDAAFAAEALRAKVFGVAEELPVALRTHAAPDVRDPSVCVNGHPYAELGHVTAAGKTRCRQCSRDACRRYYQRSVQIGVDL